MAIQAVVADIGLRADDNKDTLAPTLAAPSAMSISQEFSLEGAYVGESTTKQGDALKNGNGTSGNAAGDLSKNGTGSGSASGGSHK